MMTHEESKVFPYISAEFPGIISDKSGLQMEDNTDTEIQTDVDQWVKESPENAAIIHVMGGYRTGDEEREHTYDNDNNGVDIRELNDDYINQELSTEERILDEHKTQLGRKKLNS